MNNILTKVLTTDFNSGDYCNDYKKKLKNNCYDNFISLNKQYDLKEIVSYLKELNLIDDLSSIVSSMDHRLLYLSFTHGYMHNERVIFFAFVLAKLKKLSDEDLEILMDAAMYHDIARMNDVEDNAHGWAAISRIDKIVKNKKIYENEENLNLLKFIIDFHSTQDFMFEVLLENHEILDRERAKTLAYTFKAADSLDIVRLSMGKKVTALNSSYFKIPEAFSLIKVAHQLNEMYLSHLNKLENNKAFDELTDVYDEELFFHGIGFDFFKLESILEKGILSKNKLKNYNLDLSSNYRGYNFNDYICVACYDDQYFCKNSAFNTHIRDYISFYISDINVIEGIPKSSYTNVEFQKILNENGEQPISNEVYKDERFVKDDIQTEKISGIVIKKENLNKKITEVNYMNVDYHYEIVFNKVNYYILNIQTILGYDIGLNDLNQFLINIKQYELKYNKNDFKDVTSYFEYIQSQLDSINKVIGTYFELMYQKLLGKKDIKVIDVMDYIAKKHNLKINDKFDNLITFSNEQFTLK